jgi:glycosyltransferase involved in cell wall biosynthesis
MKVMWFTNTFLPEPEGRGIDKLKHSGGWMLALCTAIREIRPEIHLSIVSTGKISKVEKYTTNGIDCFVVPMSNQFSPAQENNALEKCLNVLNEWKPDIIHIHGTERFYGLLSQYSPLSAPITISIQGLMIPYSEWYHFFGNRSLVDLLKVHRLIELPVMRGLIWDYYRFRKAAVRERQIITSNRFFMGRTTWDRAHLTSINPDATYYTVGEVLRDPFWDARWTLSECKRRRILFINPNQPRKGIEILLKAADTLKPLYPDLEIAIIGEISNKRGYGRYIKKEIQKRKDYAHTLGPMNAEEIAREMCNSSVFVCPSYIENSSNAVCEAQLVGIPVAASHTGGLPSLIQEGRTGLFFPSGDAPYLAAVLAKLFKDDVLCEELSENSRKVASKRHDTRTILNDLINAYSQVIAQA